MKSFSKGSNDAMSGQWYCFMTAIRVMSTPLFRVLGYQAPAEQVLSDIFIEIWRSPKRFVQFASNYSGWMAMVARNLAMASLLHTPASDLHFASSSTWSGVSHAKKRARRSTSCLMTGG